MDVLSVEPGFLPTLGIPIAAGRNFSETMESDQTQSVSSTRPRPAASTGQIPSARGSSSVPTPEQAGKTTYLTVIGMIQDYHTISLHQKIEPQLILYNPESLSNDLHPDRSRQRAPGR